MEVIVIKHIARILKYIVVQQLVWGRGNVVVVAVFINMLLVFILVVLSLLS